MSVRTDIVKNLIKKQLSDNLFELFNGEKAMTNNTVNNKHSTVFLFSVDSYNYQLQVMFCPCCGNYSNPNSMSYTPYKNDQHIKYCEQIVCTDINHIIIAKINNIKSKCFNIAMSLPDSSDEMFNARRELISFFEDILVNVKAIECPEEKLSYLNSLNRM